MAMRGFESEKALYYAWDGIREMQIWKREEVRSKSVVGSCKAKGCSNRISSLHPRTKLPKCYLLIYDLTWCLSVRVPTVMI